MALDYTLGDFTLITRILKNIAVGVFHGIILYFIFVVILPFLLTRVANIPLPMIDSLTMAYVMGFFIALGIISSSIKPCIGILFDVIASLIGLHFVISVLGSGELKAVIEVHGYSVEASFSLEPLLLLIIGFSIVYVILNMFSKLIGSEE